MFNQNQGINGRENSSMEILMVRLTDPMLYDRLHILSTEYSVSDEVLINVAVKRLIDDVEFVRGLRVGNIKQE